MPRKPYDTTAHEPLQATPAPADEWAREVVSRLPEHTQQQARVLKAFERSRQIRSASDLLRGLLAYVYTVHSFQHLSIWSVLVGVADVSANDWRKRLQGASTWLTWLLQEVLAASTAVSRLSATSRVATHLAHRWDPFHVPRSSGHGVAGAYRL